MRPARRIVPNDAWAPTAYAQVGSWCRRRWWSWPRRHRSHDFLMFDPALPSYRRCPRCGRTAWRRTWRM